MMAMCANNVQLMGNMCDHPKRNCSHTNSHIALPDVTKCYQMLPSKLLTHKKVSNNLFFKALLTDIK